MVAANLREEKDEYKSLDFGPDGVIEESTIEEEIIRPVSMEDIEKEKNSRNSKHKKRKSDDSFCGKVKHWCKKHWRLLLALLIAILAIIALFIIDRNLNKVHLHTTTSGLSITYETNNKGEKVTTEMPVRVLAYNADMGSSHEMLYFVDTVAKVDPDGTVKISWVIPRDYAYRRDTYNEFCILDKGETNDTINEYCGGSSAKKSSAIPVDATSATSSTLEHVNEKYNRISCAYFVPAHTNGIVSALSGWNKLSEEQKVGCTTETKDWGDSSYLHKTYGFGAGNFAHVNEKAGNNGADSGSNSGENDDDKSMSGLTMENFFQSILNAYNSNLDAGEIIKNSFSNNFVYDDKSQVMNLSNTGVAEGQSCDSTYTTVISRPAPVNGSDNSTSKVWRCIPVFTVDEWGRITEVTSTSIEYDGVTGNEVVGVTGSYSGLERSGAGTFLDPYTLAVALNYDGNGGLKIDSNGKLAVVAPECTAKQTPQIIDPTDRNQDPSNGIDKSLNKLQWTYDGENGKFTCAHDVDNQQLDMAQDSNSTVGLSEVETYTVSLSGDKASSIQFVDRDTRYIDGAGIALNLIDGANIFSADLGNGNILLCPDGGLGCSETEKTIQVNLGGDNNSGFISGVNSGGLEFAASGKLQISAPTCGGNEQVLTWDGSKFVCVSGTDWNIVAEGTAGSFNVGDNDIVTFLNGTNGGGLTATRTDSGLDGTSIAYNLNDTGVTAGAYTPSVANDVDDTVTSRFVSIPIFTVNSTGQLTQAGNQSVMAMSADLTKGITIDSDGDLSIAGLDSVGTDCAAGSGLTWTGTEFTCTTAYVWGVQSGTGDTVNVAHGMTVSFAAGSGLSITDTTSSGNQTINYAISLASGSGLQSDASGLSLAKTCTVGQLMKWDGSAWACDDDIDTTYTAGTGIDITSGVVSNNIRFTTVDLGTMGTWSTIDGMTCSAVVPTGIASGQVISASPVMSTPGFSISVSGNSVQGCYHGSTFDPADNPTALVVYSL